MDTSAAHRQKQKALDAISTKITIQRNTPAGKTRRRKLGEIEKGLGLYAKRPDHSLIIDLPHGRGKNWGDLKNQGTVEKPKRD